MRQSPLHPIVLLSAKEVAILEHSAYVKPSIIHDCKIYYISIGQVWFGTNVESALRFHLREMNVNLGYIKYDQGGVIMDVINPEQVRDPALPLPFTRI